MTNNYYSVAKVDYRGAAAPKNNDFNKRKPKVHNQKHSLIPNTTIEVTLAMHLEMD